MNQHAKVEVKHSTCPHDCPSACALDIEVIDGQSIGRVRGSKLQSYTAGVVCAKVARYAERVHHPDRLTYPQFRVGPKGSGRFARISWDDALDEIASRFNQAEREFGAESVWPYYYAGTMGLVMRDGINRLAHVKKYSRFYSTICSTIARVGFAAGTGKVAGVDPREMGVSDLVVIWGTNPVNTQVNVMTHAARARKERGARIAAIDVYNNDTMKQADIKILLRPGTDGAFACGVMHVLFREGFADRDYLARYTDCPGELEAHLATRTPEWASSISGVPVGEIEAFARAVGQTKRSFFRLGYGFTRSRNGAAQMHAALCIPAVTGAWQYEGGGAFFNNYAIWKFNESLIEGHDAIDHGTRLLDQSKIGRILTGDPVALKHGPPVKAMLIQNTNPMTVAPEQALVRQGFARPDLFTVVHEQFMTETAEMADLVLPATMFIEHDDLYYGGGHQHISVGAKLIEPPGECRSNHEVLRGLARRAQCKTPRIRNVAAAADRRHAEEQRPWRDRGARSRSVARPAARLPHLALSRRICACRRQVPLQGRLGAGSARQCRHDGGLGPDAVAAGSLDRDRGGRRGPSVPARHQPVAQLPQHQLQRNAVVAGARGRAERDDPPRRCRAARHRRRRCRHPRQCQRGETTLTARLFEGLRRGVLIAESVHPNKAHIGGRGINMLTGAEAVAPVGGAAFHDNKVWVRKAVPSAIPTP